MGTIVAVRPLEEAFRKAIQEAAPGWELIDGSDPDKLTEHLPSAEVLLGWRSDSADVLLREGTPLKWVQNWGAGVEHLPLERFKELGITLTNASGVHPYPISEHIFAMLLSLTRRVHTAIRNQASRIWALSEEGMGEAHGRTIGILGVGSIGSETARLAKAFHMTVLGLRNSDKPDEWVDRMYTPGRLNELLAECDFVVNCLPYTKDTEKIMGKTQFEAMKPGSFYINIGRGATTDTSALVEALKNGTIAGAGLDVFEEEPLSQDHPLWDLEQVILTPHNAGSSTRYNERLIGIFTDNLRLYAQGQAPGVNVVDLIRQY
ncbi:D-2-hydroxyacid dehydrogenase [Paenibacillus physcomitrellae]|uniref:3-phosphoglycerate dehydrogenase n=1 Tax=Paenibacillus physcomitrellae TaxID=1619311 RepID=A0ABQ1GJ81_9BACL|nr:D-2-hydroxyacid dehydrogenase [Paenibacillus physcomitrellae]GGA44917.1 3-phosphoglycerate dehydrogenase [Paenibacillus physcomitrellae]